MLTPSSATEVPENKKKKKLTDIDRWMARNIETQIQKCTNRLLKRLRQRDRGKFIDG